MTVGAHTGRIALRRYPALAFLGVAALLAVALPSALTVPNAGPPTLAEFAPVPGQGTGGGGDIGRLGAGSSGGPGIGGGEAGPGLPDTDPGQPTSNLKRCVGNPPRQTEDPLSPPCVAFFEGDNGGKTWRGVTRDEVKVVVYYGTNGLTPYGQTPPVGSVIDYGEPPSESDFPYDYVMKVYARYFNERYQTYGRRVHLYGYWGTSSTNSAAIERRRNEARAITDGLGAFAAVPILADPYDPFVTEVAAGGAISVSYDALGRALQQRMAPSSWTTLPDHEDEAAITAGHVCAKLKGRPARYSGDVADQGRRRVFGIAYTSTRTTDVYEELRARIATELRQRCGVEITAVSTDDHAVDAQPQARLAVAALRERGVTTVIMVTAQNTAVAVTGAASATGWHPEWFIPGARATLGMDRTSLIRLLPADEMKSAFGITFRPRFGDASSQHWSRSYRETCGCEFRGVGIAHTFYDPLAMLFYGIQAGGARLTPSTFQRGMFAIPRRGSGDPYSPASYFTPGNYSFYKDAMEIWWDPSGQGPGDRGAGCFRLSENGARRRAGEWPRDDDGLFRLGTCNGAVPYP